VRSDAAKRSLDLAFNRFRRVTEVEVKPPTPAAIIIAGGTFENFLVAVLSILYADDFFALAIEVDRSVEVIGEPGVIQNVLLCVQRSQSKPPAWF